MYFVFKERIDSGNIVSVTYLNVEGTVNIALYFINTESICSVFTLWGGDQHRRNCKYSRKLYHVLITEIFTGIHP